MMNHCRINIPDTVKYLRNIDAPFIKWKIHYTTVTPTATNYVLIECSYPKTGIPSIEAAVMLLRKYFLDQCVMNGFVGYFNSIVYRPPTGPRVSGASPPYIIVDLP